MKMLDLRQLSYLVALDRRRSFARAAEDLGLSQSALSRAIQALEKRLGMRLFDRDRAGVFPTELGREIAAMANDLIAAADDIERQAVLMQRGSKGRLRFGMAPLPAHTLLAPVLADRITSTPDLANDVIVRNVEDLWPLLLAGEIEFFVSAEGLVPDNQAIREELLGEFPVTLVVRAGHPLLERPPGEMDTLAFPLILSSRAGLLAPDDLHRMARGTAHVIEDFASLVTITQTTDAIWSSSHFAVISEIVAGRLCALPYPGGNAPRAMRMMIYSSARRSVSPAARALRAALQRTLASCAARSAECLAPPRT
jgi:DNA-binding transcriptional LysR family regulator